jgi:hypothetical protein
METGFVMQWTSESLKGTAGERVGWGCAALGGTL